MPSVLTYPGVYVDEIPSGVRTIVGVGTSIAAFIGRAERGPTNDPVVINSFGDFERIFGGLWAKSRLGYAVRDFFLNGGSQAIIVRLFNPSFKSGKELETALTEAQTTAAAIENAAKNTQNLQPKDVVAAVDLAANLEKVKGPAAAVAAEYIREEVKNAAKPQGVATQSVVLAAIDASKKSIQAVKAALDREYIVAASKENVEDRANNVVTAVQEASNKNDATVKTVMDAANDVLTNSTAKDAALDAQSILVQVAKLAGAAKNALPVDVANAVKNAEKKAVGLSLSALTPNKKAGLSANGLELEACDEGEWGNKLRARVDNDVLLDPEKNDDKAKYFNLTVRDNLTRRTELFRALTFVDGPRQVAAVLKNESRLVRVKNPAGTMPTFHAKLDPEKDTWADDSLSSPVSDLASDGNPLSLADFTGPEKQEAKEGLYALRKTDLFNILCIPPYKDDIDVHSELIGEAAVYCEYRRAILLVDPPSAWKYKEDAKNGVSGVGTNSKNAALFFPRLQQPDPLRDGQIGDFVPSGAVAGIFARTDSTRGVWKAPAGFDATLVGVPQLSVPLTDAENGELNPLGINCLRSMPAAGRVVWGSRTLKGDDRLASEWKYIPVRRTALFIEESLYRGTHWVVFEPNDEPLWGQIRLNVGAFMNDLYRKGAFQGQTPRDAYFVKCDKETTTQTDINLGIVNILIGFAPLKPAEFVVIKLQQIAGQIQT